MESGAEDPQEAERRDRRRSWLRWLVLLLLLLLLLCCCGQLALLTGGKPRAAQADTRSQLRADYHPWPLIVIPNVDPQIVEEIEQDRERYPEGDEPAPTPTPTPTAPPPPTPTPTPDPLSPVFWFYPDDTPYQYMMYQVQSTSGALMSSSENVTFHSLPFEEPRTVPDGLTQVHLCVVNRDEGGQPITFSLWANDDWLGDQTLEVQGLFNGLLTASFNTYEGLISEGGRLRVMVEQPSGMTTVYWNASCNDARLVLPGLTGP